MQESLTSGLLASPILLLVVVLRPRPFPNGMSETPPSVVFSVILLPFLANNNTYR
jgi:hypothetical protein